MSDISVNLNGYRINLRVGAVVNYGNQILMCRLQDQPWYFLPGGRIKTNESSLMAMQRELSEEIGNDFRITRPVVCAENFFNLDGLSFHEICTFYEVEWIGSQVLQQLESSNEVFEWIPRWQISDINLKPDFMQKYIVQPKPGLELVIYRDETQLHI